MIWLSSKSNPVLCVEHKLLKINFVAREILKTEFCEDNNHASSFIVDLAMGYYNEHPTMVGGSICKSQ